jgi:DNA-binding ferritin-like protein
MTNEELLRGVRRATAKDEAISRELAAHVDEIARRCEALGSPPAKKSRRKPHRRSPKD